MANAILSGFDSAWTDNPKRPGALAHIIADERTLKLVPPELRTFDEALAELLRLGKCAPFHLVALDQPTIVPNPSGSRPVERAVASVISKLKGGVQPSNRGRKEMFGDCAPVWRFLRSLGYAEIPYAAHGSASGQYLIEMFPALAIAGLFPRFVTRGRLPKYNPERRRTFQIEDWRLLMDDLITFGTETCVTGLAAWAQEQRCCERPRKSDQDRTDAVICALQALLWWKHGFARNALIGDKQSGYMVASVSPTTRSYLKEACGRLGVPFCAPW